RYPLSRFVHRYIDGGKRGDRKISHMIAKLKKKRKYHRIVYNGFLYNISTTRTSDKRYYRCANKKNSGCLATAVLGQNASLDSLTILRPHNHPRDKTMEMKYNFEMELTKAVKNSNASIKNIYYALAEIQPEAARIVPYDQNLYNRLKRRRISSHDMFGEDYA
ncbi:hypothetical protein AMK59_3713, partial [Oryctes borbonicus]